MNLSNPFFANNILIEGGMKKIKLIAVIAASLLHSGILAQSAEVWYNPRLLSQGIQADEHNAIGRSDDQQCATEARIKGSSFGNAAIDCLQHDRLYGAGPYALYMCDKERQQQQDRTKEIIQDLYLGCLGSRGWIYGVLPERYAQKEKNPNPGKPQNNPNDSEINIISTGTGFFINALGYFVTNEHVVKNCNKIAGQIPGGDVFELKLVTANSRYDLALLKANPVKSFAIFSTDGAPLGERIVVYGFPLAGILSTSGNFTTGSISGLAGLAGDSGLYQISAPIQSGNSGGAVLNTSGHVVGVVKSKINASKTFDATGDTPQNVNFAIKGSVVANFLDAQGVEYQKRTKVLDRRESLLAEEAARYTALVACVGY